MLIYGSIAGCRHIDQFNESLKKSYYRVTRMLTKSNRYHPPAEIIPSAGNEENEAPEDKNDLSMSEAQSFIHEMKEMPVDNKRQLDLEFKDNFSFNKYLEL